MIIIITEENVAAEMAARNPMALEYAMDRYGKALYILACRILDGFGRPEDIEECVSDVFVDAWNRIGQYESSRSSFKTWLHVLVKYKALDYRRRLGKRREETPADGSADPEDTPADPGNGVEDSVLRKERFREAMDRINRFEALDRAVFLRRYFFNEDIEAIACHLGITRSAVYNRLWRSRNALKEFFG